LVTTLREHIEAQFMSNIKNMPLVYDDKTVAEITIQKSTSKPVYLKYAVDKIEFYCRALNTTQSLNLQQANDYIKQHWKNS
jgi:hypothetical protein